MTTAEVYSQLKDLCYLRLRRPEAITRREIVDGQSLVLIFDDVQRAFYQLHGNAGRIWEMLDGQTSLEAIVDRLHAEEGGERHAIVREACRFIAKLGRKGLIKAALQRS